MPHALTPLKVQVEDSFGRFIKYTENPTKYAGKLKKSISLVDVP